MNRAEDTNDSCSFTGHAVGATWAWRVTKHPVERQRGNNYCNFAQLLNHSFAIISPPQPAWGLLSTRWWPHSGIFQQDKAPAKLTSSHSGSSNMTWLCELRLHSVTRPGSSSKVYLVKSTVTVCNNDKYSKLFSHCTFHKGTWKEKRWTSNVVIFGGKWQSGGDVDWSMNQCVLSYK